MHHKFELSSIVRTILAFPRVPSYSYKPLTGPPDAIRLVHLQPAPFLTSPISCRVVETSWSQENNGVGDHKGFVALSYTWGDPKPRSQIEIDGRPFYITRNLELALRHLRSQRKELRLWADSVCINQEDIEERNQHVRQMREIYAAAKETTIFLGDATESSDAIMSAIQDSKCHIASATTQNAVVKSLVNVSGLRRRELVQKAFELLWRPYWVRMWIFQEIVVSNNPWIQCGSARVPWEDFCQALTAILNSDSEIKQWGAGYGNEPKRRLENMYWERRAYRHAQGLVESPPRWGMGSDHEFEGRMKLLDLLVTKRGSEASDSRDMVFAVAGIATKPTSWNPISITYEKSPAWVYMGVVQYLLSHHGTYEILSHAGQIQDSERLRHRQQIPQETPKQLRRQQKIPSWAPDWRVPSEYKNKIVDWIPPSSTSVPLIKSSSVVLEDHGILICTGHIFSTVSSLSDSAQEIEPSPRSIGRVIWDNKWHRRKLIQHGVLSDLGTKLGTVSSLFARSHPLVYKRKLAKAKGGITCLVPGNTREGDVICQFVGGTIPFILRPMKYEDWKPKTKSYFWDRIISKILGLLSWSRNPDLEPDELDEEILKALKMEDRGLEIVHFSFVGECFVDGLMGGHAYHPVEKNEPGVVFAMH